MTTASARRRSNFGSPIGVILALDSPKSNMGPKTLRAIGLDGASMSFIGLYARVLGRLGPEKWLAAGLVVANVALAVSQFAEPMLFGKIIDYLTRSMSPGNGLQWSGIGPWLAAWAGFGIFSIVASVTVALNSDRLAHRRRVVEMAAYFDHVLHLPMSFHAHAHTGRLLKIMIEGASGMFGVWLSFFREHFAALVALGVLLPATLIVNWRARRHPARPRRRARHPHERGAAQDRGHAERRRRLFE